MIEGSSTSCSNCNTTIKEIEDFKLILIEKDELIKRLKQENEELISRYDDLNIHMNSMMTYLESPVVYDNIIIPKENFSSNTNLDIFKENFETKYFSKNQNELKNYSSDSNMNKDPLKNSESNEKTEENLNEKIIRSHEEKYQSKFFSWPEMNSILIEIISENIFYEFKCQNCLHIYNINKTLLSGSTLSTHINTIFLNEARSNLTLSIYHEYIQTIFIHIFLSLLKVKPQKISSYDPHNKSKFSWMISEEINYEVISKTVEEIYSIYFNININAKTKINGNNFVIPDREIFFERTFDNLPFSKDSHLTKLKQEILFSFVKKVKIHEDTIKEDLFNIVKLCRNFIHAGKIVFRNKIIFDFWKLHSEIKFCNLIISNKNAYDSYSLSELSQNNNYKNENKYNRLVYIHSCEEAETLYNLQNYLKFHWEGLETIEIKRKFIQSEEVEIIFSKNGIQNNTDSQINNPLENILVSILSNNNLLNQIKSFTMNFLHLTENEIFFINCIIEFAKNLNTLDLSHNCVEDKGLRSISEALKLNKSITQIYLNDNSFTNNGAFYLSDMLLKNESLTHLYLNNNNITGMGLQSLISTISNGNKSIIHLDLSDNKLTNHDVIITSNLITKNCQHFEGLNLSNNILDGDSVNTLGLALKTNVFLKQLYLNNIGLNEDSTPYFFQHLVESNLREITLDNNNLGEIGGVLFANVIKSNNFLRQVSLKNTQLNSNSLICISHALEIEMSKGFFNLKIINLEENKFDDDSIFTLINSFLRLSKNFNDKKNSNEFSIQNLLDYPFINFSYEMLCEKSMEMIKNNKLGFIQLN